VLIASSKFRGNCSKDVLKGYIVLTALSIRKLVAIAALGIQKLIAITT
jgi:hypothetical protein